MSQRKPTEEQLTQFFNLSLDMFCIAGFDGYFKRLNPAWEKILGYRQDELLQEPYVDFIHPEDRESTIAEASKLTKGQETIYFENRYRANNGEYKWLSWTAKPDTKENIIYAVARDITARRRAEQQLKNYARDLETAKQTEEQNAARLSRVVEDLKRAKAEAEEATRAKSDFLANMSHEIRTPIYAVVGMTELALGTKLTAEQREYLTAVRESADALLHLVNDILDFSKIEARMLELDRAEFNLRETVEDSVRTLALRAQQKGLELACHIEEDVPARVVGDETRLGQVIVNLVNNAIKFTHEGEVVARVEKKSKKDQEVELEFIVSDTGIGIPPDKQELIFEAFAQADSSMTRKYGGTGLGLAISAEIVKLMDGSIAVESKPDKGSTFRFTACFELPKTPPRRQVIPEQAELRNVPVLIVDDNATNRRILEETVKMWNMRPTLAEGGKAALTALEKAKQQGKPFRLALVDSQMPEMDGFTLAQRILSDPAFAETRILMLTSAAHPEDFEHCRRIGVEAFLTKPVTQSDLIRSILRALGETITGEELETAKGQIAEEKSLRILLAEDNPINQRLTSRTLEKRGHRVETASNGNKVLEIIDKDGADAFDLILMDVQMPGIDGLETTAAIRDKEKKTGGHVPIIAMTAHALKGDRERCLKAGMDNYLPKPIEAEALFAAIERHTPQAAKAPAHNRRKTETEQVLDEAVMMRRVNGDRELLGQLIDMFLEDCPKKLRDIQQAVADRDAAALHRSAHSLKGSIGIFLPGSEAFHAALKLEEIGREGELDNAQSGFDALQTELGRLKEALTTYRQELAGAMEPARQSNKAKGH